MSSTANSTLLASLRTATNLSLADLADLNSLATSSPRLGASQDEVLARQLWRRELQHFSRTLSDGVLARDLQQALRENRSLEAVRREREAREPTAVKETPVATTTTATATTKEQIRAARFGASLPSTSGTTSTSTSNSSGTASRPIASTSSTVLCYVCQEPATVSELLLCGHRYCRPCLRQLFLLATKDESLHPASCCKIKIFSCLASYPILDTKEEQAYKAAEKEFAVASKDRLYCSKNACSAFLGTASTTKRSATCSKCLTRTCAACRSPWHSDSQACAADKDDEAAAKLVAQLHGTRCASCYRVVMRRGGCPEVICRCGRRLRIEAEGPVF